MNATDTAATETTTATRATEPEVLITRLIDAPRELVFQAWIDPAHLARWFAPRGCTLEIRSIDAREGGALFTCIRNPQYPDCWCKSVFQEIAPPKRLVYTSHLTDEAGNPIEPMVKDPDWPGETTITVTFDEEGDKTRLTLQQSVGEAVAKRTGAYGGWLDMLERLQESLANG